MDIDTEYRQYYFIQMKSKTIHLPYSYKILIFNIINLINISFYNFLRTYLINFMFTIVHYYVTFVNTKNVNNFH